MAMSARAVYVVNIDGEQYRRPVANPYVLMHKVKTDIKTHFQLDYDFDLTYKGSKILDTSSLDENGFDDSTPLVVSRKRIKQSSDEGSEAEHKQPVRSISLPRLISRAETIPKVWSLNNLIESDIEDETETHSTRSMVLNEGYHWKATTIICLSPARSVEEKFNSSLPTLNNGLLSSGSKLPSSTESVAHSHVSSSPAFSTKVEPTYSQNSVNLSVPKETLLIRRRMRDKVNSSENLSTSDTNRLPNNSSNVTFGYSSSSSSRSSSPDLSDFHLIVPTANRDFIKSTGLSSQVSVNIQTLSDIYTLHLSTNTTLKQLHSMVKEQLQQLEKYTHHTHTLLFFNTRMHIFTNTDIKSEYISTFLSLETKHNNNTDDRSADFFVYVLEKELSKNMYLYEQDPSKIFNDSIWWQSHSEVQQTPLAHSTLLSTLYVLYQYFRRPPLNQKASRRALEIQFLLYLRKYLFPPAFQALKHLLIREVFLFEKTVLMDGLLRLLSKFCPSSVDRNLLGIYAPHLFCWLFERSCNEMETQDGFLKFNLMRYSSNTSPHYINDPVTIHDLDHDRSVLYEHREAERYKNITRNVDIFSLIKYLPNTEHNEIHDLDTYTIDLWGCHNLECIDRLTEEQMSNLADTMARVYQSFTILIRNALENSDVRDQLILVANKQVGICFKRRQRVKSDGRLDQDLRCFMPADPSHSGIISLSSSDVFEVEDGRPDPQIPTSVRSNLPMKSKPSEYSSPVEQITIILLDISESMFDKRSGSNTMPKRFIDISINMLKIISKNLHRQSQSHAVGMILFGKQVITHCSITTNPDEFEKAISTIPKHGQPWTSMYDAINTGFDSIHQYETKHRTAGDCEKLIICITDGINNRGTLTIDYLKQRVRRTPVVMDLVFFSAGKVASYTPQERNSIKALRLLCEQSGGIIYRNSSIEPIDLATTYEQEAVLWLKSRKVQKSYGRGAALPVDWPVPKEPEKLYQTAVRVQMSQKLATDFHQQTDLLQRLHAEVNDVVRKQIDGMELYICRRHDDQMDYTFWKETLQGPQNSLYAGGHWLLYVTFPDDYPIVPPKIRFHTPIFHLNITADGYIYHDLLDIGWSTVTTMAEIFRTIKKLLIEPDIRNAVSEEYAHLYEHNRSAYDSRVYQHCKKHAWQKLNELKRSYRLEDA